MSSLKLNEGLELVKLDHGIAQFSSPDVDMIVREGIRVSMDVARWDTLGRPSRITLTAEKL